MIKEALKEKGIKLKNVTFIEEKKSGTNPKRPKFNKMIEDLENGKYQGLIAYSLDRLSRNLEDSGKIFRLVIYERKVKLLIAQRGYRDIDWTSRVGVYIFVAHVMGAIFQVVGTQVKTKDTADFLKHQGRQLGKLPFGYKKVWINKKNKEYKIVVNEEEAEVVKEVYNLALEHGWGRRKIAAELGLTDSQVRFILSSEKYTGFAIVDGEVIESELPAIISIDDFCELNPQSPLCKL